MSDVGLRVLTCERCATLLDRLRSAFAAAGVRIEDTVLWYDLADVRWVAALRGPVLDFWGAAAAGEDRAGRAAYHATLLDRTAKALEACSRLPGYKPVARHLKNFRLLSAKGPAARQASDHLYEMEVAARLSRTLVDVRLDEPDIRIVVPDTGVSFSIACKRPQAVDTIAGATRDGVEQIRKQGTLGVVFVCVDRIIDTVVRDRSGRDLGPECDGRLGSIARDCWQDVSAELRRFPATPRGGQPPIGVLGVILCATFVLFGRDERSGSLFMNTCPLTWRIPMTEDPWVVTALICLEKFHAKGEQAFRNQD